MKPLKKAVIPAAGHGTRVLPASKTVPKEMLTVVDRPALQYIIDEAFEAGIEHVVIISGRGKSAMEDYFDHAFELEESLAKKGKTEILDGMLEAKPHAGSISYTRQQQPLGLGHAVWCAKSIVGDEPFAVLLPDVIINAKPGCLKQMVDAYAKVGGNIIAVNEVPEEVVDKYGVIAPKSRDGNVIEMSGMVEKPPRAEAPSNLSITGRYILQPEIFNLLETQERGAGGEIQLTDAMATLMKTQAFHAYQFEGAPYDCGDKLGWLKANIDLALERADIGDAIRDHIGALKL